MNSLYGRRLDLDICNNDTGQDIFLIAHPQESYVRIKEKRLVK